MKTNKQIIFFYLAKLCMNVGDVLLVFLVVDTLAIFDSFNIYPFGLIDGIIIVTTLYMVGLGFNFAGFKSRK